MNRSENNKLKNAGTISGVGVLCAKRALAFVRGPSLDDGFELGASEVEVSVAVDGVEFHDVPLRFSSGSP